MSVFVRLVDKFEHRRPIGATTVGTGEDWSPTFRLGTNNVLVPQLPGRSFQKARNFTEISINRIQDLASEFSEIFRGHTSDPHNGRERPPPAPNKGRARGTSAPLWDPNLGPLQLFSRGCAPA